MNRKEDAKIHRVEEIVQKSGNNFHFQVVKVLREGGWDVLISPYYSDNVTHKSREIDIIAERAFDHLDSGGRRQGTVNVRLFVECKYISSRVVFWFDRVDGERVIERIIKDTPLKRPDDNGLIHRHHWMHIKGVAKLFASNPERHQENEPIYKALNQSLNALVYYRNRSPVAPRTDRRREPEKVLAIPPYPVIVCSSFDSFYRVDTRSGARPQRITEYFQLEVNYAYLNKAGKSVTEYFLIDVVDFKQFDTYLQEQIEKKDVKAIRDIIGY